MLARGVAVAALMVTTGSALTPACPPVWSTTADERCSHPHSRTMNAAQAFAASRSSLALRHGSSLNTAGRERCRPVASLSLASMCICINCKLVDTCKAYHFVEQKHQQPHLTNAPTFEPRDGNPTIEAIIRNEASSKWQTPQHLADKGITIEYDVVACADFGQPPSS